MGNLKTVHSKKVLKAIAEFNILGMIGLSMFESKHRL